MDRKAQRVAALRVVAVHTGGIVVLFGLAMLLRSDVLFDLARMIFWWIDPAVSVPLWAGYTLTAKLDLSQADLFESMFDEWSPLVFAIGGGAQWYFLTRFALRRNLIGRLYRLRQPECPDCGNDLRRVPGRGCPFCGWNELVATSAAGASRSGIGAGRGLRSLVRSSTPAVAHEPLDRDAGDTDSVSIVFDSDSGDDAVTASDLADTKYDDEGDDDEEFVV